MFIKIQCYLQHPASVDWLVKDKRLDFLIEGEVLPVLTAFTEIGVDATVPWGKSYYQIIRVFLRKQIQNNTIHVFHMKSNTRRV